MLPLVAHGGQTDQAYDIKGVDGAKLLVDVALRGFDRHHPGLEEAPVRVAFLYLGACSLYQGGGRLAEAPEGVTSETGLGRRALQRPVALLRLRAATTFYA